LATADDLGEVSRLLADAVLVLGWCASPDAMVLNPEEAAEPVIVPDDLRVDYAAAFAQLTGLVPDYETYFGRTGGVEEWGPVVDRAGWSGPLLQFKLRILRRGGRDRVVRWARGHRPPITRRLLKWFLEILNIALDSLSAIPGVDLIKELKEFLERAVAGEDGDDDGDGSAPDNDQKKPGDGSPKMEPPAGPGPTSRPDDRPQTGIDEEDGVVINGLRLTPEPDTAEGNELG
jgi:hypothetical protein